MATRRNRGGREPDAGAKAAPTGAPEGPRRPGAQDATRPQRPSAGEARPSLVSKTKESTLDFPDLRLRYDDVGRGFLYEPMMGGYFTVPDPCTGQRQTDRLSRRAVRQIKGAAIKAHNMGTPMRTFITFTVRQQDRAAFLSGDVVLGKEIKRTLNALNEWLRRRGRSSLLYIWVAENVRNENPHVHMLTSYSVLRSDFDAFAAHLESLWGYGFAKIERVKKPERAGRYIMKALGYTMKGADDDQGTVIGNRYGISRKILPKYELLDAFDCSRAADNLRLLQGEMTEDIEELAPGLWMTKYGLSFEAGTDLSLIEEVIDQLAEAVHMSD